MPRRTKLTDDTHDLIVELLAAGNFARAACAAAGINEATYYRWLERGAIEQDRRDTAEEALDALPTRPRAKPAKAKRAKALKATKPLPTEEPYRAFREACARACAQAENRMVDRLVRAGDEDWRAALAYLERRVPDWRASTRVEHGGPPEPGEVGAPGSSETAGPIQIVAGVGPSEEVTQAAHDFLRVARERRGQAVDPAD